MVPGGTEGRRRAVVDSYLQLHVHCNLFVHRSNLHSKEIRVRQPIEHFSFTPGFELE